MSENELSLRFLDRVREGCSAIPSGSSGLERRRACEGLEAA